MPTHVKRDTDTPENGDRTGKSTVERDDISKDAGFPLNDDLSHFNEPLILARQKSSESGLEKDFNFEHGSHEDVNARLASKISSGGPSSPQSTSNQMLLDYHKQKKNLKKKSM